MVTEVNTCSLLKRFEILNDEINDLKGPIVITRQRRFFTIGLRFFGIRIV
jgi:hypothetical protein